jgi:hypothetical protein
MSRWDGRKIPSFISSIALSLNSMSIVEFDEICLKGLGALVLE